MNCREMIVSEDFGDFIVEGVLPERQRPVEQESDGMNECLLNAGIGYAFLYRELKGISKNGLSDYRYDEIPKLYGRMDSVAVNETGALRLQNISGLQLKGSGILMGIVDDGINAYHPAFRYTNGNTRIRYIWNQEDQTGEAPLRYGYGSEYSADVINQELAEDNSEILDKIRFDSTHGTFVAGIAGGSKNIAEGFESPAPSCEFIIVKLKPAKKYLRDYYLIDENAKAFQENDIVNGINYIIDKAIELSKPVIICLPLGSNQGGHSGLSLIGDYLNSYGSRTGVGVAVAIGNESNEKHHYSGRIKSVGEYDDVQIRVNNNGTGFTLELWGRTPDVYEIEIISPTGERIGRTQSNISEERSYRLLFEQAVVHIRYELVERKTGQELIQVRIENATDGVWTMRVYGTVIVSGEFNVFLPIAEFIRSETYFLKPDPFVTFTIPSDASVPISVAGYNSFNEGLYVRSGRGYPLDMTVKPTIAAPAVNVLGPGREDTYIRLSGTSVAAGITAGIMAQFMEWGIVKGNKVNMNTIEIKSYFIRGAKRQPGTVYPNREIGYGVLDAYNSIDILRR